MLEAVRRGFLRNHYDVTVGGMPLTTMQDVGREGCEFVLDGLSYAVTKDKRKEFTLSGPGDTRAAARLARSREWVIGWSGSEYALVKPGFWREEWELQANTHSLGTLRRRGALGKTVEIGFAETVPMPLRLLALHLVSVLWRRSAGAAASSGGGG